MKIFLKFHVPIFYIFRETNRQRASRTEQLIVLNDLASPKMVIRIFFNYLLNFSKVLEMFECHWSDIYTWLLTETSFASLSSITKMIATNIYQWMGINILVVFVVFLNKYFSEDRRFLALLKWLMQVIITIIMLSRSSERILKFKYKSDHEEEKTHI